MGSILEHENEHVGQKGHVVLFPFMSKGHTIPLLHLSRLFLDRGLSVTVFTTLANRPFIHQSLAATSATVLNISFPQNISPEIPVGIESTDKLPSINLFHIFALATQHMQPEFEQTLQTLPRVSFMVADGFLWWTHISAAKFGFPSFVFYGFGSYPMSLSKLVAECGMLQGAESDTELMTVTRFPWIKITKKDFPTSFANHQQQSHASEFMMKVIVGVTTCLGIIINSFYELEPVFTDYWNAECKPRGWCVGPLYPLTQDEAAPGPRYQLAVDETKDDKPVWIEWLDEKLEEGIRVLYVAFGSQAEVAAEQLEEIAKGLEKSMVNFLWVVRSKESETATWDMNGFEERVKGRGMVVKEWVDQRKILVHGSVDGFVSHCGWNSMLESICAGVPILAWPMMADQPVNARFVVEEIKVGLMVETCDGSMKGFVKWEGLEKMVKELMEGEEGKVVRKNAKKYAELAREAVKEGGSSWRTLGSFIDEATKHSNNDQSQGRSELAS